MHKGIGIVCFNKTDVDTNKRGKSKWTNNISKLECQMQPNKLLSCNNREVCRESSFSPWKLYKPQLDTGTKQTYVAAKLAHLWRANPFVLLENTQW